MIRYCDGRTVNVSVLVASLMASLLGMAVGAYEPNCHEKLPVGGVSIDMTTVAGFPPAVLGLADGLYW